MIVTVEEVVRVVNDPVLGVVAPTVPLMLIEAVPVRFVTVPDEGVPRAPPLTTKAPAEPTLTPKAVATPEPKAVIPVPPLATASVPVTPVDKGRPVAFVSVPLEGVPNAPPLTTTEPTEPTLTPKAVATLVPKPEIPVDTGKPVALVSVTALGVPRLGVVRDGLAAKTMPPEPVTV